MDTTLGNFYLQVQFSNLTAVVWIADNSVWRLIECSPDSEWPQMNTWRRGTWKTGDNGMARCYAMGSGSDAPSANNQTQVEVVPPPQADGSVVFGVVYADADIVVVDKPAGLVVHPGAGHRTGTLVNGVLSQFPDLAVLADEVGTDPERPGIVHRLDRGTSG